MTVRPTRVVAGTLPGSAFGLPGVVTVELAPGPRFDGLAEPVTVEVRPGSPFTRVTPADAPALKAAA